MAKKKLEDTSSCNFEVWIRKVYTSNDFVTLHVYRNEPTNSINCNKATVKQSTYDTLFPSKKVKGESKK